MIWEFVSSYFIVVVYVDFLFWLIDIIFNCFRVLGSFRLGISIVICIFVVFVSIENKLW